MIRPKPDIPERYPILTFPTPEGQSDLLFYELRDGDLPKNKAWSYGDPHPDAAKFPNHELVFVDAAEGGAGWQRWYYAANRENQHLYNWQFTDTTDWPQLAQTFIVRRSDFSVTSTYEMPPLDVIPYPLEWSATGVEERPIGDETLASTFVTVVVTREKIRVRNGNGTYSDREIVGREFDPDTNSTTSYRRTKVPAGTVIPEGIQSDGSIIELQPVNTLWSIKNTKQAAGLAGKSNLGKASRTYQIITNWAWPAVLDYVRITPEYSDPGDIYSAVTGYVTVPVYAADAYSGPCLATIVEEWTSKIPIIGGDPTWDSTKLTSPELPPPTPLLPKSISFRSTLLDVSVPECLHGPLNFYAGNFEQFYPATNYPRWPGSVVAEVTLRPNQGGWLKTIMLVNPPSQSGVQPEIVLELDQLFATSFNLKWNALAGTTVLNLDVATSPTFASGFLAGFNNRSVLNTTSISVTGAARGVTYYCRLKSSRVESYGTPTTADDQVIDAQSATLAVTCPPLPEIFLATPGANWPATLTDYVDLPTSTGTVAFGDTQTSAPLTKTVIIQNRGLLPLLNLAVNFSGTNASNFSIVGTLPTSIESGGYAAISVQFAPTIVGSKTATMTVTSNASNTPSYTVALSGNAVQPEIDIKYLGTSRPTGSTLSLGNVDTGSSGTYALTIFNTGNGPLTLSTITVTPGGVDQEALWDIENAPSEPIAAGGSATFNVKFTPVESATRTAVLSIANNDTTNDSFGNPENPYTITLSAVGVAVGKIRVVAPDTTDTEVPSGGSYYFGLSGSGTLKLKNFKVANVGVAPLTISSVVLSGTDAARFSIGSLSPASPIAAGSFSTLPIGFTPPAATGALYSATLTINNSDPTQSAFVIQLSGTGGTEHEIQVESPEGTSLDGISTLSFPSFGSVLTGASSTIRFWIRNVGNANLNSIALTKSGTHEAKYFVTALTPSGSSLAAGHSAYFDVTLTPGTTVGYLTAQVSIASGDADENPYIIPLRGFAYATGSLSRGQPSAIVLGQTSASANLNYGSGAGTVALTAGGFNYHTARPAVSPTTGRVAVADTMNHRVLIWDSYTGLSTGKNADYVLGQTAFNSGFQASTVTSSNLNFPSAVAWYGDKLLVSDFSRARVLIWNNPRSNNEAANLVLGGQSVAPTNPATAFTASTGGCTATLNRGITDIFVVPSGTNAGKIIATDPHNFRVLIWSSFPTANVAPATLALGQSPTSNLTARVDPTLGDASFVVGGVTLARFAGPSSSCVSPTDGKLYIADQTFGRVLVYAAVPTSASTPPSAVLFRTTLDRYAPTVSYGTSSPKAVSVSATGQLAVSDYYRVVLFYGPVATGSLPDSLLGQPFFEAVTLPPRSELTLRDASGLMWQGGDLLVTDNNRVVIFKP